MLYQLSYIHQIKHENITGTIMFCKKIYSQIFICIRAVEKQPPKEVFDAHEKLSYI